MALLGLLLAIFSGIIPLRGRLRKSSPIGAPTDTLGEGTGGYTALDG